MATIGSRVRSLREYKDWSQEDLARKSGLQRPHISLIENNERTPGADSLGKLATALETSVDYLLGLSDDPSPRPIANHPSLRDPLFAELADAWLRIPRDVQEKMIIIPIRIYLELLDKKTGDKSLK